MKSVYFKINVAIFIFATIGNLLFVNEINAQGTVVMSSEIVRENLTGDTPVTYPIVTSYSSWIDSYFLEDHSSDASLFLYDATAYNEPMSAGPWYSTCVEPACYTVNQAGSNAWLTGNLAYHASDFRNAKKVLDFFYTYYGRSGADNNGEDLIILSGIDYNDATAMGVFRCIALGKPDYPANKPSFGTIGIMAHKFAHIMSWHEWIGVFDYGTENSLHGVKGTVDEHLANLFGTICTYYLADESWINNIRWAFEAERDYGDNYPHRNDADFYSTMNFSRNVYLGTDSGTSRAYVSQIYCGSNDAGGIHKNMVLLDRAAYLFTEGGHAAQAPGGTQLANWPSNAPDVPVQAIGMDRLAQIAYKLIVTPSFVTPVGTIGLGDIGQIEQDYAAMKTELTRYAYIVLAAAENLTVTNSWPPWVPISVRNGFASVGLLDADSDYDGILDTIDNCPLNANSDQTDEDIDGIGDVCDTAGIPALISPINNFEVNNNFIKLYWEQSTQANSFELQVSTDINFSLVLINPSSITDTTFDFIDLTSETDYYWHVRASNNFGTSKWSETWHFNTSVFGGEKEICKNDELWLKQNYPNPLNQNTIIEFNLPQGGLVQLSIFDVLGKEMSLLNQFLPAGIHKIKISKNDLSQGVWFYQLKTKEEVITKKMIVN